MVDNGIIYDTERLAAIAWSYVVRDTDEQAHEAISVFGYEGALSRLRCSDRELADIAGSRIKIWREHLEKFERDDAQADRMRALSRLGVCVLIPGDELWPQGMDYLGERSPLTLWVRGSSEARETILGANHPWSVSIVGSRAASDKGMRTALDFAYELSSDYVITSGGAFGIDAAAHRGALAAGGRTVIFSAAGVDRIYPASHAELFKQVWRSGLVISEFPFGTAPHAHRFLQRNRLIAAMSRATVVVEAPIRSGALNTARAAMEIGRPVGAVPGSIHSQYSLGCHELIRNGGTLVASVKHVRELINPIGEQLALGQKDSDSDFFLPPKSGIGERGQCVLDAVPVCTPIDSSRIANIANIPHREALQELAKLALAGYVEQRSGGWVKTPSAKK